MSEKIKNVVDNVKEFVEDHLAEIFWGAYSCFCVVMFGTIFKCFKRWNRGMDALCDIRDALVK